MAEKYDDEELGGKLIIATEEEHLDFPNPECSNAKSPQTNRQNQLDDGEQALLAKDEGTDRDKQRGIKEQSTQAAHGMEPQKGQEATKLEWKDDVIQEHKLDCSKIDVPERSIGIEHQRIHNFLSTTSRKEKILSADKSTCVSCKAIGQDEHLSAMRPGTNLTIDIAIICKAGTNMLYFSAKWKGREYHGVLTEGEPLISHSHAHKRNAAVHNVGKSTITDRGGTIPTNSTGPNGEETEPSTEKDIANGMAWRRSGGKRGGGHAKGGGMEKRTKTQELADSGIDRKATDSGIFDDKDKVDTVIANPNKAEKAESGQILDKPGPSQSPHERRHRPSFSSSSNHADANRTLHDHGMLARVRCSYPKCGFRFETPNELNNHLLFGPHGIADTRAKVFESVATQTCAGEEFGGRNSTAKGSPMFCAKCSKALISSQLDRPTTETSKNKQKSGPDNSPAGFSDISDDAAPTLEKEEENFDKHHSNDSSDKRASTSSCLIKNVVSSSIVPSPDKLDRSQSHQIHDCKFTEPEPSIAPPTCSSPEMQQKASTGSEKRDKNTGDHQQLEQTLPEQIAHKPSTTTTESATTGFVTGSFLTTPSNLSAAGNTSAFQFNPFLALGSHLNQAIVPPAMVQDGPSQFSQSADSFNSRFLMSAPSGTAGLLSLDTPLSQSSAAQSLSPNRISPKSAATHHPIQHKLYELQTTNQNNGNSQNSLIGRASSTKPCSSNSNGGKPGESSKVGNNGSGSSPDLIQTTMLRPNSTISAIGHQQQSPLRLPSGQPQFARPFPSSIGIGGPFPHHQPSILQPPFFPSLASLVPGQGGLLRPNAGQNNGTFGGSMINQSSSGIQPQQTQQLPSTAPFIAPASMLAGNFDLNLLQQYAALTSSTSANVANSANGQIPNQK